ncbi:NAD-dependent epimerase/dehydratase family protein [Idiomarina sp. A28L]|uniref:NAD-dependent epimerase/dehydratase family protein n=1 Tax=Idiomarina sp. A28L TaxID=1036674 RepID=UPI0002EE11EC|nr:NAD-dependent epimerase/dehydratase family protein [Idiomarina sp. A28L]
MADKIFLTGATGFVGSALLNRFIADGASVKALVRSESVGLPGGVEKIFGDLSGLVGDFQVVKTPRFARDDEESNGCKGSDSVGDSPVTLAMNLKGCDVVVHTAARVHIIRGEGTEYLRVNRDATLVLARLAAEAGVKRFVFVSSIKVNGEMTRPGNVFVSEISQTPTDPYGLSKREAEQGLLEIAKQSGMEVVIVRPPLVYGPNVKGNFAAMVNWVKKGVPLPLGAMRNARSLVALDNLVDFIAVCADPARSPKAANEVFLISDGVDVSTSELLRKVARALGVKSRLFPIPVGLMSFTARLLGKGAVADRLFGNLQVDSSKACDLLGWRPVVTMDEQLHKMYEGDRKK